MIALFNLSFEGIAKLGVAHSHGIHLPHRNGLLVLILVGDINPLLVVVLDIKSLS